jgi:HAE1 family hydrophobic/amphiphilic exporter-1
VSLCVFRAPLNGNEGSGPLIRAIELNVSVTASKVKILGVASGTIVTQQEKLIRIEEPVGVNYIWGWR